MKAIRNIAFGSLGIMILVLAIATILEKIYGSGFASQYIYSSIPFACLWLIIALSGTIYLLFFQKKNKIRRLFLHGSFILILVGACITWLFGEQGSLYLRKGDVKSFFSDSNDDVKELPFQVSLNGFHINYYNGTDTPMDFVSEITIHDSSAGKTEQMEVAMNKIGRYKGYRFYQSGYDLDRSDIWLSVAHDPYGIGITYSGYAFLLFSILLFFTDKHSSFRQLISHPLLLRRSIPVILLLASFSTSAYAIEKPQSVSKEMAARIGNLYILYNGRFCPLQTMAKEFTVKLHGSASYEGYNAEQVFAGWMFYSDKWEEQPFIKIKSHYARTILGIRGKYASLKDFFDNENQYKLAQIRSSIMDREAVPDKRGVEEADEQFNIIQSFYSGRTMKLFPYRLAGKNQLQWFSPADRLPSSMDDRQNLFIRKSLDCLFEMVRIKSDNEASLLIDKIRTYQQKEAGDLLPSSTRFEAEKLYNNISNPLILAVFIIIIGLIAFIQQIRTMICQFFPKHWETAIFSGALILVQAFLTFSIVLRWYVSGHIPLANGFETMLFMAWCALLIALLLQKRFAFVIPFGALVCGMALMVAAMGESNPRITPLMPVLLSPLLSIHVVTIMLSYALLAFVMFNGITAFVLYFSGRENAIQIERLYIISRILLYPALFLLASGIFVGAVWANVSWGRYWSWDPKEVWALITLLVYSLSLHTESLPWFRRPIFFHLFGILAFLSVLVTYFGVNFILGGMHSYAG